MAAIPLLGNRIDRLTGVFPLDFPGGDIADFYAYCYTEREIEVREINNRKLTKPELSDRFGHFAVSTLYVPIYRIHSKKHFYPGSHYPKNWEPSERKKQRSERYSPFGTEGFYYGLTLKAAEDEVKYYSRGKDNGDDSMILVIECCFDNILYLTAGVIHAIWEACGLEEPSSMIDMYLKIMDPRTDNPITNAIGLWARKKGFDGLIYPSARYGQEEELQKKRLRVSLLYLLSTSLTSARICVVIL